jgi:hypothetical protein
MGNGADSGVNWWGQKIVRPKGGSGATLATRPKQLEFPKIRFRSSTKVRAIPAFAKAIFFSGGSLSFA